MRGNRPLNGPWSANEATAHPGVLACICAACPGTPIEASSLWPWQHARVAASAWEALTGRSTSVAASIAGTSPCLPWVWHL